MKANAPEKIYIPRLEGNETFVHEWSATKFRKYFDREVAENVEYTRTDAFIEKACEYISEHIEYYMKKDKMCNVPLCPQFATKSFVENFRKYIGGE